MRRVVLAAVLCAAAMPCFASELVRIDTDRSHVDFVVHQFGVVAFPGRFGPVTGWVCRDAAGTVQAGQLKIAVGDSVMEDEKLTPLLIGGLVFDAENYPYSNILLQDAGWIPAQGGILSAEVTVKDVTAPVQVTLDPAGIDAEGIYTVTGSAEIERSRFDIDFGRPLVSDIVELEILLTAIPDAATPCPE